MGDQVSLTCPTCRKISAAQNFNPAARYGCPNCGTAMVPSAKAAPSGAPPLPEAPPVEVAQALVVPENKVGRYVLVTLIGRGAMGQVWRGWDTTLKRWVAVKVMRFQDVSPEDLARFRREAKTAAAMDHPNIAPIYDMGEAAGRHYIVMKLIEGETVESKYVMPPGTRSDIGAVVASIKQASRGLAHAHARGVVHRDVKPANMMQDKDARVYLMDFGLAKPLAVPGVTGIGGCVVLGTPAYMAPEAAKGLVQFVNSRSDVFSMGASLYSLLTGRALFPATGAMEQLRRAQSEKAPRTRLLRADVPAGIDEVIARATSFEARDRFADAGAFADALDVATAVAPVAVAASAAAPATAVMTESLRALVVDDEPQVLQLLMHLVESIGLRPVGCRDGVSAEAEAKKGSAALVVLDEGLPDVSGFKLIQRLRAIPGYEKTPFIMVTGRGGADNAARALETGADEFMGKPISPREFKARAMKLLKK
ncbi:MAG: protein kinase [Planctomycetes bacterium]|nr:protein kinase [Planctomycetota bacterium]